MDNELNAAFKNHPNAPLDAFVTTGTKKCRHPNLDDLFIYNSIYNIMIDNNQVFFCPYTVL